MMVGGVDLVLMVGGVDLVLMVGGVDLMLMVGGVDLMLMVGGVDLVLMVGGRCSRVSYPWDGSRGTWVSWPSPRALDGGVSTCPVP